MATSGAVANAHLYDFRTRMHAETNARKAKIRFALGAAQRLLENRPPEWPVPKTAADTIATVKRMMATPRKFGVFLTAPERAALEWAHALHAQAEEQAKTVAEDIKQAAQGLDEPLTLGEVSKDEDGGGSPVDLTN